MLLTTNYASYTSYDKPTRRPKRKFSSPLRGVTGDDGLWETRHRIEASTIFGQLLDVTEMVIVQVESEGSLALSFG